MSRWWVISQQGSGFSSEPLYVDLHGFSEGMSFVGDCLVEASALDIIRVNGLNMAAHCCSEMGRRGQLLLHILTRPVSLCTTTAPQQTLMEVNNY